MSDKQFINEHELPASVPTTDTGWNDMLSRLDNEMPDRTAVISFAEGFSFRKMVRTFLILLLLLFTWIVVEDNKKSIAAIDEKFASSTNKITAGQSTAELKNNKPSNGASDNLDTINSNTFVNNTTQKQYEENLTTVNSTKKKPAAANNKQGSISSNIAVKAIRNDNEKRSTTRIITSYKRKKNIKYTNSDQHLSTDENSEGENDMDKKTTSAINSNIKKDTAVIASPGTLKAIAVTVQKTPAADSTETANTEKDPEEKEKGWKLQAGLQWELQVPTAATGAYFQGADTKQQPWRILLPGVWLQAINDRKLLTLEINPFFSNLVPAKTFRTLTTMESIPDTTVTTTQVKSLRKLFAVSAAVSYDINVSGNWWLGGSLQACWYTKAVATTNGAITKMPLNGSPAVTSYFQKDYRIKDEWNYFSKFQFYLNAEALYREKKWQAGFRTGIAATPLAKQDGPSHPLRLELFYRLKLFDWKVKK